MKYSKEDIWQETKDYIESFIGLYYLCVRIHRFYLTLPNYKPVDYPVYPLSYTTPQVFLYNILISWLTQPLLIAAIKILGFRFCLKTIVGTLAPTLSNSTFSKTLSDESGQLPMILGDQTFMACVLGACCEGVGLAIVFFK